MGDKGMTPENISSYLNILGEDNSAHQGMILSEPADIMLDPLGADSSIPELPEDPILSSSMAVFESSASMSKVLAQSRSYPNTPLPMQNAVKFAPTNSYPEDNAVSR